MRSPGFLWIIVVLMALLDLYIFQIIRVLTSSQSYRVRIILFSAYWVISVAILLALLFLPNLHYERWSKPFKSYVFALFIGLFFSKLVATVFFLIDDIRRAMMWLIGKLFSNPSVSITDSTEGINRSVFLSWLGLAAGGSLLGSFIYGFRNKYRYQVKRVRLQYANLPQGFKGLKIVHISDIHSGSFMDKAAVNQGIRRIMQENADLVLFTGDLVNDKHDEMDDYADIFSKIKAPMGVFSTLGNHDYGDYTQWGSAEEKRANLQALKQVHKNMGWRLLMNEHVELEKNGSKIALLGIENWSAKGRFPKYGKMHEAYPGAEKYAFKILMSHDPSHWDAQVRTEYPDIDLMLSGHTHGMQFGVELPGIHWSPIQYMYKQWAGLYEEGKQKLYVNPGYGFIGYPGRVGILPEITVIELV